MSKCFLMIVFLISQCIHAYGQNKNIIKQYYKGDFGGSYSSILNSINIVEKLDTFRVVHYTDSLNRALELVTSKKSHRKFTMIDVGVLAYIRFEGHFNNHIVNIFQDRKKLLIVDYNAKRYWKIDKGLEPLFIETFKLKYYK